MAFSTPECLQSQHPAPNLPYLFNLGIPSFQSFEFWLSSFHCFVCLCPTEPFSRVSHQIDRKYRCYLRHGKGSRTHGSDPFCLTKLDFVSSFRTEERCGVCMRVLQDRITRSHGLRSGNFCNQHHRRSRCLYSLVPPSQLLSSRLTPFVEF